MANNPTDGKKMFGKIVAGDDNTPDPQCSGRVKFMCAFHHPDTPIDQLPWSQIGSQAGNIGGLSFNRPPQLGTMVEVYFPQGAKGSGHGIISNILHNIPNTSGSGGKKGGDQNLSTSGWSKTADETKPSKASGPARVEQKLEENPTSKAKKLTTTVTYDEAPSMKDRSGTNSSGVNKATLKMMEGFKGIASAAQYSVFKMDASGAFGLPGFSLPGVNINLMDVVEKVASSLGNESLQLGLSSIAKLAPSTVNTISEVTNMVNNAGKTDPAAWLSQAQSVLSGATSQLDLQNAMHGLNAPSALSSLLSGESITQAIPALLPGLSISKVIDPSGNIEIPGLSSLTDLVTKFTSEGVNGMVSAATKGAVAKGGGLFGPQITSDNKGGLHAGLSLTSDLLLMMDEPDKMKKVQDSIKDKFVHNDDFHEIGLHFAWFASDKGKNGQGNTVKADGRGSSYKSGSSIA